MKVLQPVCYDCISYPADCCCPELVTYDMWKEREAIREANKKKKKVVDTRKEKSRIGS